MSDHEVLAMDELSQLTMKQRLQRYYFPIIFSVLALLILIGAFALGYVQLTKVNTAVANIMTDTQSKTSAYSQEMATLQQSVADLHEALQKSEALSAKQAQQIAEWNALQQRDVSKLNLAQAEYDVKLANDQLQFSQNMPIALLLLQRANQALAAVSEASIQDVRNAIAENIAAIQALPSVDINQIYAQLNALNQQVDQLSLPEKPLSPTANSVSTDQVDASWWQNAWQHTWSALSHVVIVKRMNEGSLPIVMPEEKQFLLQNLHAQMEGAMWGLVNHNNVVYQANLVRMIGWLQQYFAQDDSVTKSLLQNLQALQKINVQQPTVDVAATLKLFDRYQTKAN